MLGIKRGLPDNTESICRSVNVSDGFARCPSARSRCWKILENATVPILVNLLTELRDVLLSHMCTNDINAAGGDVACNTVS